MGLTGEADWCGSLLKASCYCFNAFNVLMVTAINELEISNRKHYILTESEEKISWLLSTTSWPFTKITGAPWSHNYIILDLIVIIFPLRGSSTLRVR